MKRDVWTVGNEGVRPAGPPDRCFYCDQRVGGQHAFDCVIRQKTVVVELVMKVVIAVPESWGQDSIHFRYNESTYCYDNMVPTIEKAVASLKRISEDERESFDRPDAMAGCLCSQMTLNYVGDATEQDEAEFALFISETPS